MVLITEDPKIHHLEIWEIYFMTKLNHYQYAITAFEQLTLEITKEAPRSSPMGVRTALTMTTSLEAKRLEATENKHDKVGEWSVKRVLMEAMFTSTPNDLNQIR